MLPGVGTAPDGEQPITMPDPGRLAARSVALLRSLGLSRYEAAETILTVTEVVRVRLIGAGQHDVSWVKMIQLRALDLIAAHDPSQTERTEITDADGSSSSTGRDESQAQA
jgi:hypothetical protein